MLNDEQISLRECFQVHESAHIEYVRQRIETPGLLRDLLELAIWDGYGLVNGVVPFLQSLPKSHRALAGREFTCICAELRSVRLIGPLHTARGLRAAVRAGE